MKLRWILSLLIGSSAAHAQALLPAPSSTPAPELAPAPATVPVRLFSTGSPLTLGTYAGSASGVISGLYSARTVNLVLFRPMCATPCTLYLPPGPYRLEVTGYGIRTHTDVIDVPPGGADMMLRAPSAKGFVAGFLLVAGGVGALAGGAALVGMGEMGTTSLADDGHGGYGFVTHSNRAELIGGGVMMAAGAAMLGGGIALISMNRGGVASSISRDPAAPTAKLSIGPGSVRVSGSF